MSDTLAAIEETFVLSRIDRAKDEICDRMLLALLKGELQVFDKRVEIIWPDGMPLGMTTEDMIGIVETGLVA